MPDIHTPNSATDVQAAQASSPGSADVLRVLYVEDNRVNAMLFQEAMRLHGPRLVLQVAENGAEAIDIAASWQPALLVLDAQLPDLSGFELLSRLRQVPGLGQVPAYMCSANAMPDDLQRARDAGFTGYWVKPIHLTTVLHDVAQWLPALRETRPNPSAAPGQA